MSSKSEKDKTKILQDKCQSVLNGLLRDEDNKYCVDCDSKGPRWASWNIGVFLCIRCAGIHRNLGVHISRVKSVNLDSWTPEQVVSLQQMGNSRARAVYEANLPDNFRRPQNDGSLETFVRAKYEQKKYIAREWVPPTLPKVNWEKEIDEELEKQKRKTKTVLEKKPIANVEVPQIPKPKNPSPKPNRIINTEAKKEVKKSSDDLLGLGQNGDDSFSNFLSAAPTAIPKNEDKKTITKVEDIQSEEKNFFNQKTPSEKEKIKLTKDSIMSLYASTPQIQPLVQSNVYQQQIPQMQNSLNGFQNFAAFPQGSQVFPGAMPNGMNTGATPQNGLSSLGQAAFSSQWPGQPVAPVVPPQFANMPSNMHNMFQPTQNQFMNFAGPIPGGPVSIPPMQMHASQNNMFPQQKLQQQFGSLSLGSQPSNGTTNVQPLTPNIWQ